LLENPWISPSGLARFLAVSRMTVYRAVQDERIKGAVRIAKATIRLRSEGVREWLRNCVIDGTEFNPGDLGDGKSGSGLNRRPGRPRSGALTRKPPLSRAACSRPRST
jgi:excisionase family DNA binding protein